MLRGQKGSPGIRQPRDLIDLLRTGPKVRTWGSQSVPPLLCGQNLANNGVPASGTAVVVGACVQLTTSITPNSDQLEQKLDIQAIWDPIAIRFGQSVDGHPAGQALPVSCQPAIIPEKISRCQNLAN